MDVNSFTCNRILIIVQGSSSGLLWGVIEVVGSCAVEIYSYRPTGLAIQKNKQITRKMRQCFQNSRDMSVRQLFTASRFYQTTRQLPPFAA